MSRRREIRNIHKKYRFFYEMLAGAAVIVACVLAGAGAFGGENIDYRMNLFTEGMGIVATVFIINRWYAHREREDLKRRLIREAGSRSNDIAISAVEWLRREGWLCGENGLLQDAKLDHANLRGANLGEANLQRADLRDANLQKAVLIAAQLQNAIVYRANLSKASMELAKLHHADLFAADLSGAKLFLANLTQTRLDGANLRGASLTAAKFKETVFRGEDVPKQIRSMDSGFTAIPATLPDGTEYKPEVDMDRFTDSFHSDYESTRDKINECRKQSGMSPLRAQRSSARRRGGRGVGEV